MEVDITMEGSGRLTRDFTLCCIDGDTLDIDCVRCVLRYTEDVLAEHGLNVLDDCLL